MESNNRALKRRILDQISLNNLTFSSLDAFEDFVAGLCRENNNRDKVKIKLRGENLKPLPESDFGCFKTSVASINKFSLFSLENTGHMYSVPSGYIGLSLEVRIHPKKIEAYHEGELVCSHNRIYGPRGLVSIKIEHIIKALVKKPAAMRDWKHREVLFERPAWKAFYEGLKKEGGSDKDYLRCLSLILGHGREKVTVAMELAIEEKLKLTSKELENLITNEMEDLLSMAPLEVNLSKYDEFLEGEKNGSKFKGNS